MKKAVIAIFVIVGIAGIVVLINYKPQSHVAVSSSNTPSLSGTTGTASTATSSYHDGTFTGNVVDNPYGSVQVAAVISGGKITNVHFLQMPSDRSTSVEIAAAAKPILLQETIKAQSANVDIVSGATFDSQSYAQSLQSALTQAQGQPASSPITTT